MHEGVGGRRKLPGRGLYISLEVGMGSSTMYSRAERKLVQLDCKEEKED